MLRNYIYQVLDCYSKLEAVSQISQSNWNDVVSKHIETAHINEILKECYNFYNASLTELDVIEHCESEMRMLTEKCLSLCYDYE